MKKLIICALVLLSGCSTTNHPVNVVHQFKEVDDKTLEEALNGTSEIDFKTHVSANWTGPLSGLVNMDNPIAKKANLKNEDVPIQIYSFEIIHPKFGTFLIDTGVSEKFVKSPESLGISYLVKKVMHLEKLQMAESTDQIVSSIKNLNGMFFTHMHIDHIAGIDAISKSTPLYAGPNEVSKKYFMNVFTKGSIDNLFNHRLPINEISFNQHLSKRFEGIVDIFGDQSVFALWVPGHTAGSMAFIIKARDGIHLVTGDTCHTKWGWDNGVEPGFFTRESELNNKNLNALRSLVKEYPMIKVR